METPSSNQFADGDETSGFAPEGVQMAIESVSTSVLLLRALGHPDWAVRMNAIEAAAGMADTRALEISGETWLRALVAAMADDENAGLRNAAAEVLIRLRDQAIPFLDEALVSGDADTRKFAVDCLGRIATAACRPPLLRAARGPDADPNVHAAVLDALGHVGGEKALIVLREEALGANRSLLGRAHALEALARLEAELPVADLMPLFDVPDLRRLVCPLLANSRDPAALNPLCQAAAADLRGLKQVALMALYKLCRVLGPETEPQVLAVLRARPPGTGERLLSLLSEDSGVAEGVIWIMGLAEPGPHLCAMLTHCEGRGLAQPAFQAILRHGDRAMPWVLAAIDGSFSAAQLLLLDVVEASGRPEDAAYLLGRLPQMGPEMAGPALRPIGKLALPKDLATLLVWADAQQNFDFYRPLALCLAAIGERYPGSVASALRERVDAGPLQPAWLLALAHLRQRDDAGRFGVALRSPDLALRCAALEGAALMGGLIDEQALTGCAYDPAPEVRRFAVAALAAAGTTRAEDAIVMLAGDRDVGVVLAALFALRSAKSSRADRILTASAESASALVALVALESLAARETPLELLLRPLELSLRHPDIEVQKASLRLVVARDRDHRAGHLSRALAHPSGAIRREAADLLGCGWGDEALFRSLVAASEAEPDSGVRRHMQMVLRQKERQKERVA